VRSGDEENDELSHPGQQLAHRCFVCVTRDVPDDKEKYKETNESDSDPQSSFDRTTSSKSFRAISRHVTVILTPPRDDRGDHRYLPVNDIDLAAIGVGCEHVLESDR